MAMAFSSLPRLFPPKPPFFTGTAVTTTSSSPLPSLSYYPPPFCIIPNHSLLFSTLHDSPLTSATLAPPPPHHSHLQLPAPFLPSSQLISPSFLNIQESDNLAPFLLENLLTGGEAVVAAAAAEAVALAKAAADVAKDAALLAGSGTVSIENVSDLRETDLTDLQSESTEDIHEIVSKTSSSSATPENSIPGDGNNPELLVKNAGHQSCPCGEHTVLEMLQLEKVAVRSIRQFERKTKREKAADKASASFIPVKGGYSSLKKRSTVTDIDYTDPLRYLRTSTSTSRLLTTSEELELSQGIQDLQKLEKLREELAERSGGLPTFAQWASAAGLDQKKLRKCINYGILCKDKMIKSNIRLVISIAKNYQGAGMTLQDLVQEGCQGLVRGAEKFDASKGFKFSTYAHWWIKQAVRKSLSDQSRTIRLPFHMVEATYLVREARKQLYRETGRHPDNEEVAEATGLSMKRLTAVLLTPKAPRSLDQKIGINQNLKPSEVIADPGAETAVEALMKQFMKSDLNKSLDRLNPREKQVIRWRFELEDGRMKTLQEIGELIGVSRERIRQIESCAFRKLKNKKITKMLRQYLLS